MEATKILNADILDILFEGKNKEYGAYELRKTYNRRISMALGITFVIALLVFVASEISNKMDEDATNKPIQVKDMVIEAAPHNEKPPPPPPRILPPHPQIKTIPFTPPIVVKDEEVIKPPTDVKQLKNKDDVKLQERAKNEGIVDPPVGDKRTQVVELPKPVAEDEDKIFTKVEIEASYGDSPDAWTKFITKEITSHIDELTETGESGTLHIRFIVDKDGNLSDVEALDKKGSKLAEVVINAIRKSLKWNPAEQNGRKVKAYREQPITFTIQDQ